jgi:hypothetical protein
MVAGVLAESNQMAAAARLPERLGTIESLIESVADRVSRRYFTLLPIARSLTIDTEPAKSAGAA